MKYNIWPTKRAGPAIKKMLAKPKPVNVGMKPSKMKKGNLIYKGATGAGKAGMAIGRNLYKIK